MEPVFLSKLSDSRAHTLKLTTLWAKIPTSKGCSWEWMKSSERVSQFSSVAQSCPTLCDPMNRSTPGLPVNHQLPESTQTHAHWVGDAIHISSSVVPFSSCPQSLPASGSFPVSQLFASGGQSTGVSASASVLPVNTQDSSPLGWTGGASLQ